MLYNVIKQIYFKLPRIGKSVTFPYRKLYYFDNTQEFFGMEYQSLKVFRYSFSQVIQSSHKTRVWFGPLKSFGFFQTLYSSRFSADAHRHQVYLECRSFQAGWSLVCAHFELWFIATALQVVKFDYSVTQHSPLCTNCLW